MAKGSTVMSFCSPNCREHTPPAHRCHSWRTLHRDLKHLHRTEDA